MKRLEDVDRSPQAKIKIYCSVDAVACADTVEEAAKFALNSAKVHPKDVGEWMSCYLAYRLCAFFPQRIYA